MISKIEITLNDVGQFVVKAGAEVVITSSILDALKYSKYYSTHLAFFPSGDINSGHANPIPFEEFLKRQKKVIDKIKKVEQIQDNESGFDLFSETEKTKDRYEEGYQTAIEVNNVKGLIEALEQSLAILNQTLGYREAHGIKFGNIFLESVIKKAKQELEKARK